MALGEARQSWEQTEQECLEKAEVSLEGKNTIGALVWELRATVVLCAHCLLSPGQRGSGCAPPPPTSQGQCAESCTVPAAQICLDKAVHFCRNSSAFR